MNRTQKIIWGIFGTFIAFIPAYLYAHISGPDPGYAGDPSDGNPLSCASATCHTGSSKGGPINAAGGSVTVTFSGGTTYTPGVAQTISVLVSDPVNKNFGFQMTARLDSNGQAGDFTVTPNAHEIVLCADGSSKGTKGCPTNFPVQFIEHSFPAPPPNSTSTPYTFTWTPPATNAGNIHFYVAGNAVNNNNQADAGDHVYTNTYVLTPVAAGPPPTILTGGVLNSASYAKDSSGHGSPVAPGSLVQIYGTNFGSTPAHASVVPLTTAALGNVTVTINNIAAPMLDVSPLGAYPTVGVEVPAGVLTAGQTSATANVVVTVNGVASGAQTMPVASIAPGIFSSPVGAGNAIFVFADPADGVGKIAAPASLPKGSFTIPTAAIPRGSSGFFYATGLGTLSPAVADGAATPSNPSVNATAVATPVVMVGGITAPVQFAGQASGYPGVNQINIMIPQNAPTGDAIPIQIISGGVTSTNLVTIAIR